MIKIDRATVAAALAEYLPVPKLELVFSAAESTVPGHDHETAPARPESGAGQGGRRRIRS